MTNVISDATDAIDAKKYILAMSLDDWREILVVKGQQSSEAPSSQAFYLSLLQWVLNEYFSGKSCVVEDVLFPAPLLIVERDASDIQLSLEHGENNQYRLSIALANEDRSEYPTSLLTARITVSSESEEGDIIRILSHEENINRFDDEFSLHQYFEKLAKVGVSIQFDFDWIASLRVAENEVLRQLIPPKNQQLTTPLGRLNFWNNALAVFDVLVKSRAHTSYVGVYQPVEIARLIHHTDCKFPAWVHMIFDTEAAATDGLIVDMQLFDDKGVVAMELLGVRYALETFSGRSNAQHSVSALEDLMAQESTPFARFDIDSIRKRLCEITCALMQSDTVDIVEDIPLLNQGFESLMIMDLLSKVNREFGVSLSLSTVYEEQTIENIASVIKNEEKTDGDRSGSTHAEISAVEGNAIDDEAFEPFPLTDVQQAYWIGKSDTFELGGVATHIYNEFNGSLPDLDKFNTAIRSLIERHPMLRCIVQADGQQRILENVGHYELRTIDLRNCSDAETAAHLLLSRQEMEKQVLPSDQWPLFDIQINLLSEGQSRIQIYIDNLIFDAASFEIFVTELGLLYENPNISLPELGYSFRKYIVAERDHRASSTYENSIAFWNKLIVVLPPGPELPLAVLPTEILSNHDTKRIEGRLSVEKWNKLKALAQQMGTTASGLLMCVYADILGHWSKTPQFTINMTVFNRPPWHPDMDSLVGDFTNIVLVPVDLREEASFQERCSQLQRQIWRCLDHMDVGILQIQRSYQRIHNTTGNVFPAVFTSLIGADWDKAYSLDWLGELGYSMSQTPQVWIDHAVLEIDGELVFAWDYVPDLFEDDVIESMFSAYAQHLEFLLADDNWQVKKNTHLLPQEQLTRRLAYNDTEKSFELKLLHEPFEEQVDADSARPAIFADGLSLSYKQLERQANQVSHYLQQKGVGPNSLVGVVMEKGWEQVVAVLGILKASAAYLPVSADIPAERLDWILDNADVTVVLTQPVLMGERELAKDIACLAIAADTLAAYPSTRLAPRQHLSDLAYVIYTSGSTGRPKGVMIDHQGAMNTLCDINSRFSITDNDRVLALSSLNFDLSVYDIFGLLAVGGSIVFPRSEQERDPHHWMQLLQDLQVTVWNTVPALMELVTDHAIKRGLKLPTSLRVVMMSGDWIPVNLPEKIRSVMKDGLIYSLGGATEASIWSIQHPIDVADSEASSIPYGRPMKNQQFHVLDKQLEPKPEGVAGDLFIGGIGLAKGYWKDQEKTSASFIQHPETGETLYRTGDLGRMLSTGNIEFLGRDDFQVKVRGHRIELGEIESILMQHQDISKAVVTTVGDPKAAKGLVAYITTQDEPSSPRLELGLRSMRSFDDIIKDPTERTGFKLKQHGLRSDRLQRKALYLERDSAQADGLPRLDTRRSERRFLQQALSFEQFSKLLSLLGQSTERGLPKYQYASAGGLYPLQVYLYVKPNAIDSVDAGIYYYDPVAHALNHLSNDIELGKKYHEFPNHTIVEESAFAIFLISDLNAIRPMYSEVSRDYCLLEAGAICHLLESESGAIDVGLCQVGFMNFPAIREYFDLDDAHEFLHCLIGGYKVPADQQLENAGSQEPLIGNSPSAFVAEFEDIQGFLKQRLPDYMVPAQIVVIDDIPLSANGKLDRSALPQPNALQGEKAPSIPASTEMEKQLSRLWYELTELADIGVNDNFYENGFDSLQAIRMNGSIHELYQVSIPLRDMVSLSTIEQLSDYLTTQFGLSPDEAGDSRGPTVQQSVNANGNASIEAHPEETYSPFPLNDLQQAYWLGEKDYFALGNINAHFFYELSFADGLDIPRLQQAVQKLVSHQSMLRAVVLPNGEWQVCEHAPEFTIREVDLRVGSESEKEHRHLDIRDHMIHNGPGTEVWPLFEFVAIHDRDDKTHLLISISLLIMDGQSFQLFFNDLNRLYRNPHSVLKPIELSYRDYQLQMLSFRESEKYAKSREYWWGRIAALPAAPELPISVNPASLARPQFTHRYGKLEKEQWASLKKQAAHLGCTPSSALLALFTKVLAGWSKSAHFTLNVMYLNRLQVHPQVNELIGNMSSTILFEVDNRAQLPFGNYVNSIQEQLLTDLEHNAVTGVQVLQEMNRRSGGSSVASMPIVFASTLNLGRDSSVRAANPWLNNITYSSLQTPQVWLDVQLHEINDELYYNFDAVDEIFPEGMVESVFNTFAQCLASLSDNPDYWSHAFESLTPQSQLAVRERINHTAVERTPDLLHSAMADHAARSPDQPAVITPALTLNYGELDQLANVYANQLQQLGVGPNNMVAVIMDKGWEQVVAVLAILRAGGAYLPISPEFPTERIALILEHARAGIVLTVPSLLRELTIDPSVQRLCIEQSPSGVLDRSRLIDSQVSTDLAYVIYTSGSTGVPKGVMIDHQGALNTILDINERFDLTADDRVFAISSLAFDLSVYDIFGPLQVGGALVFPKAVYLREPDHWLEVMNTHQVTVWNSAPSLMRLLSEHAQSLQLRLPDSLRLVMMSGDWIPLSLSDTVKNLSKGVRVVSLGGATEASIWSITFYIESVPSGWSSIPYGYPMQNQKFHVLDEKLNDRPDWVAGQLYIEGAGLAKGYWQDDDKTAASFIVDSKGRRLYRTGDLGRYWPDGCIEFLGREDFQVKVQGFRIECGEVEAALDGSPGIKSSVVLAVGERDGDKQLVAYLMLDTNTHFDESVVRAHIKEILPDYMLPHTMVKVDSIPLNQSGKVDRNMLLALDIERPAKEVVTRPFTSKLEAELSGLFEAALDVSPIDVDASFFEMGGNSIQAVRLLSKIQNSFNTRVHFREFLQNTSVAKLAHVLEHNVVPQRFSSIVKVNTKGHKRPLFCVHPIGGSAFGFVGLSKHIGSDQPFYAFESLGLDGIAEPLNSVKAMATEYRESMLTIDCAGPYVIAGYSFGGLVAFEMAKQIQDVGGYVERLIILDGAAPSMAPSAAQFTNGVLLENQARELSSGRLPAFDLEDGKWLHAFARTLERSMSKQIPIQWLELQELTLTEQTTLFKRALASIGIFNSDEGQSMLDRLLRIHYSNYQAMLSYCPTAYDGDITIIRAREKIMHDDILTFYDNYHGEDLGWSAMTTKTVQVHEVHGDHYSFIAGDGVANTAQLLKTILD